MEIIEEIQDGIHIFRPNGRLDSNTYQRFEKKVFKAIDDGSLNIIVDFKNLDYISSTGLRVILMATKALQRQGGKIVLCLLNEYVKEIFDVSGAGSLILIKDTAEAAIKEVGDSGKWDGPIVTTIEASNATLH